MHMYYLQSRYYDPIIGRFINPDNTQFLNISDTVIILNLFTYCENDSINYIDVLGERRKPKLKKSKSNPTHFGTIISLSTFLFECESTLLQAYFSRAGVSTQIATIKEDDAGSLRSAWNNLKDKDLVIINCHGSPLAINKLSLKAISKLNYMNIKLLIILACNAGHLDHKRDNVGYAFSKKISGQVLCCDGTVWVIDPPQYHSIGNGAWKSYVYPKARKHRGWVVYYRDTVSLTDSRSINIVNFTSNFFNL